jgi:hypothetical protein
MKEAAGKIATAYELALRAEPQDRIEIPPCKF